MKFKRGKSVTWVSGAWGSKKRKVGSVIEVVPPNERPKAKMHRACGMPRGHESYVVKVESSCYFEDGKDRGALKKDSGNLWPIVSKLELNSR